MLHKRLTESDIVLAVAGILILVLGVLFLSSCATPRQCGWKSMSLQQQFETHRQG